MDQVAESKAAEVAARLENIERLIGVIDETTREIELSLRRAYSLLAAGDVSTAMRIISSVLNMIVEDSNERAERRMVPRKVPGQDS